MSLVIINSCKKANLIGLDNTDIITGTVTDTVTIFTKTVLDVPVRVDNNFIIGSGFSANVLNTQRLIGYLNDPIFGETEAVFYSQIRTGTSMVDFGGNPTLDSAVIILPYNGFYGDLNSSFRLNVYELNEAMVDTARYFSDRTFAKKAQIIATKQFKARPNDSVLINVVRRGRKDTVLNQEPQIRIPMNTAFASSTFVNAPAGTYANQTALNEYFKGLVFEIDKNQTTGAGGIIAVNAVNFNNARITFYYRTVTDGALDTINNSFFIDRVTAQSSKFTSNFAGTPVGTALANTSVNQSVGYIKPLNGVKTKITFPFLQNLKNQGNIAINKAELLIKIQPGSDSQPYTVAPFIYMNRGFMPSGNAIEVPDGDIFDLRFRNDFDGRYDPLEKVYRLNVTRLIQDLLTGKITDENLFLTLQNTATSAERLVINGGNAGVNSIKLRITYTQ